VVVHFLQRDVFGSLQAALSPGGVLLYETFTRDHVDVLGSSFNPAYLLDPNELLHAFAGLHVRHYREGIVERGDHRSAVASLVAQRPAQG
jgi:tellurite methyltransferase